MRKLYWYITAYLRKHGLTLALSLLIAIAIFSFSISVIVDKLEQKRRRYVGVVNYPTLHTLPRFIQEQLSYGLTKVESDDTVSPVLAERWTIEDDGKTYRFVIKDNLYWQDGKKLTPESIDYQFQDVETIVTPNDLVFKLPDEFVPFPGIVSQPILKTVSQRYFLFFSRPMLIGLGEYQLKDYQRTNQKITQLTVESNQEQIVYRFYPSQEAALEGFKLGEVDELFDFTYVGDMADWESIDIIPTLHTNQYLAAFFNNQIPILNKNVRQALSYAVTKPTDDTRAYGPINSKSWAYLKGLKAYDQNLDRAVERLLDEIPPEPLNIELTTTNAYALEAEEIKQQWQQLGEKAFETCQNDKDIEDKDKCKNVQISTNIKISNFPDTSNFQVILINQTSPPDPDQYYLWHSAQSSNFLHYKNTRIDSLLEKGRVTPDKNERRALYQEFQQFLLEDAPAIFLRHIETYDIKRK